MASIAFIFFSLFIDANIVATIKLDKQIKQTTKANKDATTMIGILEKGLLKDPNEAIVGKIARVATKVQTVDDELLTLTTGLINPVQMRYALIDLLKLQSGVNLTSFEVIKATPLNINQQTAQTTLSSTNSPTNNETTKQADDNIVNQTPEQFLTLYKHGIKLILKGDYFKLRDYLVQLEQLEWQFFWQKFDYQLLEYPQGELHIEMYSLSTEKEFIGV